MPQLGAAGPDRPPHQQSLPCWRSFNPLFRRAGSIAPPLGAHRGGLELSTGTGLYGVCRSTQCCLAVWSRWVESSTRLGGFRALKKTTEAPYTKAAYQSECNRASVSEPLVELPRRCAYYHKLTEPLPSVCTVTRESHTI